MQILKDLITQSSFHHHIGFTRRPFKWFSHTPMRRIIFILFVGILVMATLTVSMHIAVHRVRLSEHEMDLATESLMSGQFENALDHYDRALKGFRRKREAWSGRALALMYLKQYDEALESYERVIRLSPKNAPAWNGKGMSLESLGRYDEALIAYNRALEIEPDFGLAELQRNQLLDLRARLYMQ